MSRSPSRRRRGFSLGAALDWFFFVFAGLAMVLIALAAFLTRSYRILSRQYATAPS